MKRALLAGSFLATIPAANWLIGHVGECIPNGPCLIPVAPGLMAPSGVLMIGAALVLRSLLQEAAGRAWVLVCVALGAALSSLIAAPGLALASGVAFLCSEMADWSVYSPMRRRGFGVALLAAGLVGSVVDSALFLTLAFGNLDFMAGQVVGKLWATLAVLPVFGWARRRDNPV
jgi:uncharacterized PurR-regulated membrane protein YhhQ (DUF165 family)